jgi:hypothetical protein
VNFSDPFGLCPDSLNTRAREECEKAEKKATEERERAVATCVADSKQFAIRFAMDASGMTLLRLARAAAAASGNAASNAAVAVGAAVVGPSMLVGASLPGSPNPASSLEGQLVYRGLKMAIGVGSGLELGEALHSCRQALYPGMP